MAGSTVFPPPFRHGGSFNLETPPDLNFYTYVNAPSEKASWKVVNSPGLTSVDVNGTQHPVPKDQKVPGETRYTYDVFGGAKESTLLAQPKQIDIRMDRNAILFDTINGMPSVPIKLSLPCQSTKAGESNTVKANGRALLEGNGIVRIEAQIPDWYNAWNPSASSVTGRVSIDSQGRVTGVQLNYGRYEFTQTAGTIGNPIVGPTVQLPLTPGRYSSALDVVTRQTWSQSPGSKVSSRVEKMDILIPADGSGPLVTTGAIRNLKLSKTDKPGVYDGFGCGTRVTVDTNLGTVKMHYSSGYGQDTHYSTEGDGKIIPANS